MCDRFDHSLRQLPFEICFPVTVYRDIAQNRWFSLKWQGEPISVKSTDLLLKPKTIFIIAAVFVIGIGNSVLISLPKSDPHHIEGIIISKGTLQGEDSNGDKLVVEIESGRKTTIATWTQTGARVGDRVLLNTYDRFFYGPAFQFVKVLPRQDL